MNLTLGDSNEAKIRVAEHSTILFQKGQPRFVLNLKQLPNVFKRESSLNRTSSSNHPSTTKTRPQVKQASCQQKQPLHWGRPISVTFTFTLTGTEFGNCTNIWIQGDVRNDQIELMIGHRPNKLFRTDCYHLQKWSIFFSGFDRQQVFQLKCIYCIWKFENEPIKISWFACTSRF